MLEETTLSPDGSEDLVNQEQLAMAQQELLKMTNPQEIIDEQGFERTEFSLPGAEGVSLIFKGREELPTLTNGQSTSHPLVPEEAPWRTADADYRTWLAATSDNTPFKDPFERAMEQGSERVHLIGSSTPYGIVTTALRLAEMGVTTPDQDQLERLHDLQVQLREGDETPEVDSLYDQLFAASALVLEDESIQRASEREPNDQGLMEVVLALSGDESAQTIVRAKMQEVERLDAERKSEYAEYYSYPEGVKYKEPGEKLSDEDLALVEKEHLVAIHTTQTMPQLDEATGVRRILPTASYGDGESKLARNTLHFSLNHPVENNILANFNNRPYTVITPMTETLQTNGAPTVLKGVDTFFTVDPNSGLKLPKGSIILEVSHEGDTPGIELEGDVLVLKGDHLTSSDLKEQTAFIMHRYKDQLLPPHSNIDEEAVVEAVSRMIMSTSNTFNVILPSDTERVTDLPKTLANEMDAMDRLLQDTLAIQAGNDESLGFKSLDGEKQFSIIKAAIKRLYTEDGLVDQYPELASRLSEAMRQVLVKLETARMGGEVVRSDNQSGFIITEGFDKRVSALGKKLGVKLEKHNDTYEKIFENRFLEAINSATEYGDDVEIQPGNPDAGYTRGEKLSFDWHEFQRGTKTIVDVLMHLPKSTRRMAISMGLLSYAVPPAPKQTGPQLPG